MNKLIQSFKYSTIMLTLLWASCILGQSTSDFMHAGAVQGQYAVDQNGAASYTMPIMIPPGISKHQPSLSLSYNSHERNGILGVGWSIEGLSTIKRCGATWQQDGFSGGVSYEDSDRFSIDGQRLMNIDSASSYYSDSAIYHTEKMAWSKITVDTTCGGNGPCIFTMVTNDGTVYRYGEDVGSRVIGQTSDGAYLGVREWKLSSVEDLNGNIWRVKYRSDNGLAVPDTISYTSNSRTGHAAQRFVVFNYENRTDNRSYFEGGAYYQRNIRLSSVSSYVMADADTVIATNYRFCYEYSSATGRSRLSKLYQCYTDTGVETTVCYPPTIFSWQDQGIEFVDGDTLVLDGGAGVYASNEQYWIWPGDFDGNGCEDLIYMHLDSDKKTQKYYFIKSEYPHGLDTIIALNIDAAADGHDAVWVWEGDMNGDGVADLLYIDAQDEGAIFKFITSHTDNQLKNTISYYGSGSTAAAADINWKIENYNYVEDFYQNHMDYAYSWIGDVYGNGFGDFIYLQDHYDILRVTLTEQNPPVFDTTTNWFEQVNIYADDYGLVSWIGDVNGDGLQDFFYYDDDKKEFILLHSTGSSFSESQSSEIDISNCQSWVVDVNGDGMQDIVYYQDGDGEGAFIAVVSNGDYFESGLFLSTMSDTFCVYNHDNVFLIWPGDFNGDGFTDFLFKGCDKEHAPGAFYISTSNGLTLNDPVYAGFSPVFNETYQNQQTWVADVNGDGRSDFIYNDGTNKDVYRTLLSRNIYPDLLSEVTRGNGSSISTTYGPITDTNLYVESDSIAGVDPQSLFTSSQNYPFPETPETSPMYVVSNYVVSDGMGCDYEYSYKYKGAAVDMQGWGWLGFNLVEKTDHQTGLRTSNYYYQNYPLNTLIGQTCLTVAAAYAIDNLAAEGDTLGVFKWNYEVLDALTNEKPSHYSTIFQINKTSSEKHYYTYNHWDYALGEQFQYDPYGNVITRQYQNYIDRVGNNPTDQDDIYEESIWMNDTTNWTLAYPEITLTSTNIQLMAASTENNNRILFDSDSTLTLGAYTYLYDSLINLTSVNTSTGVDNIWLTNQYTYDPYGNQIATTDPAGNTVTIVYDSIYHSFPDTKTSAPNASNMVLTEQYGYSPLFGTQIAYLDANANPKITQLDPFGRETVVQGPLPDINQVLASPNLSKGALISGSIAGNIEEKEVITLKKTSRIQTDSSGYLTKQHVLVSWPTDSIQGLWRWSSFYKDGMERNYLTVKQGPSFDQNIANYSYYNSFNLVEKKSTPFFTKDTLVHINDVPFWHCKYHDIYQRTNFVSSPAGADGRDSAITMVYYPRQDSTVKVFAWGDTSSYSQTSSYRYYKNQKEVVARQFFEPDSSATLYDRDVEGRMTSVTAAGGISQSYTYDLLNRIIVHNDPDRGTSHMHYGLNGLVEYRIRASQDTIFYYYDGINRLIKQHNPDGSIEEYTYDLNESDNSQSLLSKVSVTRNDTLRSEQCYAYNKYGIPDTYSLSLPEDSLSFSTGTIFDPLQRISVFSYPDGSQLQYEYDSYGIYLKSQAVDDEIFVSYDQYSSYGKATAINYGNGVATELDYDPTNKVNQMIVNDVEDSSILDRSYIWNVLNWNTEIVDNLSASTGGDDFSQQFGFDKLGRLNQAKSTLYPQASYDYDQSGNLINKDNTAYNYDGYKVFKGSMAGDTVFGATYDVNGNMSNRYSNGVNQQLTYNSKNRLTEFSQEDGTGGSASLQFQYDYKSDRIRKKDINGTVTYYYGKLYEMVVFPDGSKQSTRYIYNNQTLMASHTVSKSQLTGFGIPNPGKLYFHSNHLGSIVLVTDTSGIDATANYVGYDPFGAIANIEGYNIFRNKFDGKEVDLGSNLYYFNARYFDPVTARFITADNQKSGKSSQADIYNAYAFTLNNPVSFSDPTGHTIFQKSWWQHRTGAVEGTFIGVASVGLGIGLDLVGQETIGGGFIGGGVEALSYSLTHSSGMNATKDFWTAYGVGAAAGMAAILGGTLAGRIGMSAMAGGALGGITGAAAASGAEALFTGHKFDTKGMLVNMFEGAVGGAIGGRLDEAFGAYFSSTEQSEASVVSKYMNRSKKLLFTGATGTFLSYCTVGSIYYMVDIGEQFDHGELWDGIWTGAIGAMAPSLRNNEINNVNARGSSAVHITEGSILEMYNLR